MHAARLCTLIRFRTILTKTQLNSSLRVERKARRRSRARGAVAGFAQGRFHERRGQSMDMNRRQFFRVSAAGLAGSSLAVLGFSPTAVLAETRNFKLERTTETRNTCPYCAV